MLYQLFACWLFFMIFVICRIFNITLSSGIRSKCQTARVQIWPDRSGFIPAETNFAASRQRRVIKINILEAIAGSKHIGEYCRAQILVLQENRLTL